MSSVPKQKDKLNQARLLYTNNSTRLASFYRTKKKHFCIFFFNVDRDLILKMKITYKYRFLTKKYFDFVSRTQKISRNNICFIYIFWVKFNYNNSPLPLLKWKKNSKIYFFSPCLSPNFVTLQWIPFFLSFFFLYFSFVWSNFSFIR